MEQNPIYILWIIWNMINSHWNFSSKYKLRIENWLRTEDWCYTRNKKWQQHSITFEPMRIIRLKNALGIVFDFDSWHSEHGYRVQIYVMLSYFMQALTEQWALSEHHSSLVICFWVLFLYLKLHQKRVTLMIYFGCIWWFMWLTVQI